MKKLLSLVLVLLLSVSLLTACGEKPADPDTTVGDDGSSGPDTIVIGVSPTPHGEIVEVIVEDLKEEGVNLQIKEFDDYITPNMALDEGELDANYFQHIPYLEDFIGKENLDLVSLGGVHIEPMAVYSNTLDSFDDIEDGDEIAIPNDTVNGGRALLLLEANGLIKLAEDAGIEATENDIVENPKNIKFTALEAAFLPRALDDVDAAVINGNYALEAGFNPVEDSLIIEGSDSPYLNIVAVRAGEENEEKFTKLLKALQSDKVRKFIEENYEGGVIPGF